MELRYGVRLLNFSAAADRITWNGAQRGARYKQIVRERTPWNCKFKRLRCLVFESVPAIREPPQFLILFNEVATVGDFAVRVFWTTLENSFVIYTKLFAFAPYGFSWLLIYQFLLFLLVPILSCLKNSNLIKNGNDNVFCFIIILCVSLNRHMYNVLLHKK